MSQTTANWQQAILAHFIPKKEQMLLVIDPDNLMRDDALLAEIQNRNYDILELADEVTFRNHFERTYRSRWDNGEARHVVVVVHTTNGERYIPYDLWRKSKRIELSVSRMFPNLNALVVAQLDNAYYADLYPAHQQLVQRNEMLRLERPTVEFILRVVFGLDPLGAAAPARWVEFLIHKHYSARELPAALETYLVEHLLPRVAFTGLRAEHLHQADAFYAWLGAQWQTYVNTVSAEQPLAADASVVDLGDLRLRSLLGHLFAEGLVSRIYAPESPLPPEYTWINIGFFPPSGRAVQVSPALGEGREQSLLYALQGRLDRFATLGPDALPAGKTDLRDWLNLGAEWAEAVYQANSLPQTDYAQVQSALFTARQTVDRHFGDFLRDRYGAVHYYEDNKGPLNLAKVNHWLRGSVAADERLALLCFDGLALDQWYLLRDYLERTLPGVTFVENRTYAIAPTLTPVSRQALFAGRPPAVFEDTILQTTKDGERWQAYWVNHNVPPLRVAHLAVQVNGAGLESLQAIVESKNRRLGVLVNLFDDVMHNVKGMTPEADKRIYYAALRAHLENGRLAELFRPLLDHRYRIFITADHGNIAGVGIGATPAKALVESYARRVALFDDSNLAADFASHCGGYPFWTKMLPATLQPVYLPGNQLFAPSGQTSISHGGLSIEELIVPFIEVQNT